MIRRLPDPEPDPETELHQKSADPQQRFLYLSERIINRNENNDLDPKKLMKILQETGTVSGSACHTHRYRFRCQLQTVQYCSYAGKTH